MNQPNDQKVSSSSVEASGKSALPFTGFKIVEFGTLVAGPGAGRHLADLGADVIKVESITGDTMRDQPPLINGVSGAFVQFNRNKRSILVNLRSDEGRRIARKLALSADVLYQNYRPGVIEEMGLGYEALHMENQKLVHVSISGYGEAGPYADQPAYDLALQGLVGFMPHQGGDGAPQPVRCLVVDKITAYSASMAIMAALMHRERNGVGQRVTVNMLDAYATFMMMEQMYEYAFPDYHDPDSKPFEMYHPIRTADGYVIGLVGQDAHFKALLTALNRQDLSEDPRFQNPTDRFRHTRELMIAIEPDAAKFTKAEFLDLMRKHKIPFGPVNNVKDFMKDPQVIENKTFVECPDPDVGTVRTLNSFAKFERSPPLVYGRSPKAGEHTDTILQEIGLDLSRIEELRQNGIVK